MLREASASRGFQGIPMRFRFPGVPEISGCFRRNQDKLMGVTKGGLRGFSKHLFQVRR